MTRRHTLMLRAAIGASAIAIVLGISELHPKGAAQQASDPAQNPAVSTKDQAECLASGDVHTLVDRRTGTLRFVGTEAGRPIPNRRLTNAVVSPEAEARAYLVACGHLFGLRDTAAELRAVSMVRPTNRRSVLKFQQVHNGLPVLGGELVVHVNDTGDIVTVGGRAFQTGDVDTTIEVDAAAAARAAIDVVAGTYGVERSSLTATTPQAWIYSPELFNGGGAPAVAVWRIEVTPRILQPIRELVLIDRQRGRVVLHFNQVDTAMNRQTYTANNTASLPGTAVCSESDAPCAAGDAHAAGAHLNAADTYNFYLSTLGRDGINGAGMPIVSSVHYGTGYNNAFWSGTQMVYGDATGLPLADDVVGHELSHGVTQYTSSLLYYDQPGAINESLSDVFGEFIDQTNGRGNDAAAVKWLMGEDVTGLGAIRNMANPPAFGHPDRMSSAFYYRGSSDNGGVHINSGVNNKAAYLMVDGGTFNGRIVAPLGITKAAKIYYEAQTHLLTSGSDYADLYAALYQACNNLVGTSNINVGDCQQVRNATDAVEMNQGVSPPPAITIDAPTVNAGGAIAFSVANGPANPTDWVGLFATGSSDPMFVDWSYLNGLKAIPASGFSFAPLQFTAPATPGTYEVRLFSNNSFTRIATSGPVTVLAPPPTVTVNTPGVNPGGSIAFTVANGPANATDWVGLFPAGATDQGFSDWKYLNGLKTPPANGLTSASLQFTAPQAAGTYEIRLFSNNAFARIATSGPVSVQAPPQPAVTMNTSTVSSGGVIDFGVSNGPANTTDWVALFLTTASDTTFVDWTYLNGSRTAPATGISNASLQFTAPAPGVYEVRFFSNNTFTRIAKSGTVTVQAPSPPAVTLNTTSVTAGSPIAFGVSNGPANRTDWAGLFLTTASDSAFVDWMYLNGSKTAPATGLSNATLQFSAPGTAGTYNVRLFGANGFTKLATSAPVTVSPSPFHITAIFDSSIDNDPNAAAIRHTIDTAITAYQAKFIDPVTVTINFSTMTDGLGSSSTYFCNVLYSTYLSALAADSRSGDDGTAIGHIPVSATNPVNDSATINVKTANLRAVGITVCSLPSGEPDGYVSVNTSITTPGSPSTIGQYDLLATIEHEINEVLGLGSSLPDFSGTIYPMDLFRYDATGGRSFTSSSSATAFFSIDGATRIAQFSQTDGADYGDWQSNPRPPGVPPQVQDAFATANVHPTLGPSELAALDVIGYDRSGVSQLPAAVSSLSEDDAGSSAIALTGATPSISTSVLLPAATAP